MEADDLRDRLAGDEPTVGRVDRGADTFLLDVSPSHGEAVRNVFSAALPTPCKAYEEDEYSLRRLCDTKRPHDEVTKVGRVTSKLIDDEIICFSFHPREPDRLSFHPRRHLF